jgi:hypothetical protein
MRLPAVLLLVMAAAVPCAAQTKEGLPKFVVDVQGAFAGLPAHEGWVPVVPPNTPLPGHGFGIGGGAHVYLFKFGLATIGAGASVLGARKAEDPLLDAKGVATTPAVTTQVLSLHPQLSINFGHKQGWSYISFGYGVTKVTSTSTAFGTAPAGTAPDMWNPALNFGGGARWFMKPHLAGSFDVRFTKLSSREPTAEWPTFALRQQLVSFLVGISIQ